MNESQARDAICAIGESLYARGYVHAKVLSDPCHALEDLATSFDGVVSKPVSVDLVCRVGPIFTYIRDSHPPIVSRTRSVRVGQRHELFSHRNSGIRTAVISSPRTDP